MDLKKFKTVEIEIEPSHEYHGDEPNRKLDVYRYLVKVGYVGQEKELVYMNRGEPKGTPGVTYGDDLFSWRLSEGESAEQLKHCGIVFENETARQVIIRLHRRAEFKAKEIEEALSPQTKDNCSNLEDIFRLDKKEK